MTRKTRSKATRERRRLCYPASMKEPQEWLRFVYLDEFEDDWSDLALDDEDKRGLEMLILCDPGGAPVVKGTGGLRKLRFASSRWNIGKRGGLRVCYLYLVEKCVVVCISVYGKRAKDDLSPREKEKIRKLILTIETWFVDGIGDE